MATTKIMRPTFAEVLRDLREASGLTIATLGKRAGISPDTVEGYLAGRREMTVYNLMQLCKALGVSPDRFNNCVRTKRKKTAA